MPTIDTLKQRELVSNVFLELNDYLCNKALEFNDNVQSTDVDNADHGTLDDLIRNGELSLSLMRLAKFTQAENMKYIKETFAFQAYSFIKSSSLYDNRRFLQEAHASILCR